MLFSRLYPFVQLDVLPEQSGFEGITAGARQAPEPSASRFSDLCAVLSAGVSRQRAKPAAKHIQELGDTSAASVHDSLLLSIVFPLSFPLPAFIH